MISNQRRPFTSVRTLRPNRTAFDLSYSKLFTGDMGILYPVCCEMTMPGDKFSIGNEMVVRMQPLVAPILHEINAYVHYYFVPLRLLFSDFEKFITGGINGDDATALPRWDFDSPHVKGSLWDYFGFPVGVDPVGAYPLDFPRRAYNKVWNDYYRDENLQAELDIAHESNNNLLLRNWEKDYFTSALTHQQKGTAPSLPMSGTIETSAVWTDPVDGRIYLQEGGNELTGSRTNPSYNVDMVSENNTNWTGAVAPRIPAVNLNNNEVIVDLSNANTFDVASFRLMFQIQRWMERNNRAGNRYCEFLQSHFGVSPKDDRLQRSEYIGGSKAPIIVSEVLQTSETDTTPQGNMSGHGITVSQEFCGSYFCEEFGIIIGLMSIMPKPAYQQGINRQWLYETRYDFPFPEFVNLSEQAITRAEIYATDVEVENKTLFGYQARYDEHRFKPNMVCGDMRDTLDYWHLGRQFATAPQLNESFIQCDPDKRIFAVPSVDGFIISFGNKIKAIRPLPATAEPGLLDHV